MTKIGHLEQNCGVSFEDIDDCIQQDESRSPNDYNSLHWLLQMIFFNGSASGDYLRWLPLVTTSNDYL